MSRRTGELRGTAMTLPEMADAEALVGHGGRPPIPATRSSRKPGRINLKAVAEALAARGLDPTDALIDILHPEDDEGNALPCRLELDVQTRVLNELLQYTQPKLKSVEIRAKVAGTSFDINDEQAKRIAEEFLKQAVTG